MVVEWLNVSGGADASPDWMHTHVELIRRGYAWVGVSAQAVGVNGLKGVPPQGDPVRYADLSHPGDSYSYDIYSQAGQVIRDASDAVLGGLRPRRMLAAGESQSAGRMVTYIDAVHPVAGVYDGFLVHSRSSGSAPLSQPPLPAVPTPSPTLIRDDLDVPVLAFNTETDTGSVLARQPDSARYRLWEVAGTAHFDQYGLMGGATDTGRQSSVTAWFDSMLHPTNQPSPGFTCGSPINSGPQTFVLRAAVAHLDRWVARGTPPPIGPRWETVSTAPVTVRGRRRRHRARRHPHAGRGRPGSRSSAGSARPGRPSASSSGRRRPSPPSSSRPGTGRPAASSGPGAGRRGTPPRPGFLVPEDAVHLVVAGAQAGILR